MPRGYSGRSVMFSPSTAPILELLHSYEQCVFYSKSIPNPKPKEHYGLRAFPFTRVVMKDAERMMASGSLRGTYAIYISLMMQSTVQRIRSSGESQGVFSLDT